MVTQVGLNRGVAASMKGLEDQPKYISFTRKAVKNGAEVDPPYPCDRETRMGHRRPPAV
jgi:hypothetical protein